MWKQYSFLNNLNDEIRQSTYDISLTKLKKLSIKFDSTVIKAAEELLISLLVSVKSSDTSSSS